MFRQTLPKPVQDIVDAIKSHFKSYVTGLRGMTFIFRGTIAVGTVQVPKGDFTLWIRRDGKIVQYDYRDNRYEAMAYSYTGSKRYGYKLYSGSGIISEITIYRASNWTDAILEGDIEALKQFIVDLEQNGIEAFIRRIKEAIG